ncbi:tropomyosin-like [Antennarius striatus]|uniref:tropomyosin-like n=1 Tax=Antennarius striatus TaxID=241820 RepID=UPI0035B346A8
MKSQKPQLLTQTAQAAAKKRDTQEKEIFDALQNDLDALIADLQEKLLEADKADQKLLERKEVKRRFERHMAEIQKKVIESEDRTTSHALFLLHQKSCDTYEEAENLTKECLKQEDEIKRLKENYAQLEEKNLELQYLVRRNKVYKEILDRVHKLKKGKFQNLKDVIFHFERAIHYYKRLEKCNKHNNQIKRLKEELLLIEEQLANKNVELSQIQLEQSDAEKEDRELNAQKNNVDKMKYIENSEIQNGILYLNDMIKEREKILKDTDVKDMGAQLQNIKMFIQDYTKVVNMYQAETKD